MLNVCNKKKRKEKERDFALSCVLECRMLEYEYRTAHTVLARAVLECCMWRQRAVWRYVGG